MILNKVNLTIMSVIALISAVAAISPQYQYFHSHGDFNDRVDFFLEASEILNKKAFSVVAVTLREILSDTTQKQVLADAAPTLAAGTSFQYHVSDILRDIQDAYFPPSTFQAPALNGNPTVSVFICTKQVSDKCLFAGVTYAMFMTLLDGENNIVLMTESIELSFAPLQAEINPTIMPAQATAESIFVEWIASNRSDEANTILGYAISLRFSQDGNAWDLLALQASHGTAMMQEVLVTPLALPASATSFNISGCFTRESGLPDYCIAPFTTYEVVVTAIGESVDAESSIFVATSEGLPRRVEPEFISPSATAHLIELRIAPPQVPTGNIIGYWLNYTSVLTSDSLYIPLLNSTTGLGEHVSVNQIAKPYHVLRIPAVPYITYTYYVAPVTIIGIADTFTGPLSSTTSQSMANTLSAPTLIPSPTNPACVILRWAAPYPPWGVITQYQVGIGLDVNNGLVRSIVYSSTNTSQLELELNATQIPHDVNIRVRAFTAIGAGEWSHQAKDERVQATSSQTLNSATADRSWISAAVVVPVVVVLLVVIAVLARRPREQVIEFEFPAPDDWEIDASSIEIQHLIGSGAFGNVHVGLTSDGNLVAVKIMRDNACIEEKNSFLEEVQALKRVNSPGHPNVMGMVGCVLTSLPLLVVTELLENKDLKNFLIKNRKSATQAPDHVRLTPALLLKFAADIASGMFYLSTSGWVHRDLACRNCLVSADLTIKISDFGLSKDLQDSNYYQKAAANELMPVRWMAPESLLDGRFDSNGDIWSFGIVLWEIFSFGRTPYANMSNDEVVERVVMGYRLSAPPSAPEIAQSLMIQCWSANRPTFKSMFEVLSFHASGDAKACTTTEPKLEIVKHFSTQQLPSNYIVLRKQDSDSYNEKIHTLKTLSSALSADSFHLAIPEQEPTQQPCDVDITAQSVPNFESALGDSAPCAFDHVFVTIKSTRADLEEGVDDVGLPNNFPEIRTELRLVKRLTSKDVEFEI